MESCKEKDSVVRKVSEYSIELRAVRNMLEEFEVGVGSCKENVRRNGEVSDRVGSCKENVRRNDEVFD